MVVLTNVSEWALLAARATGLADLASMPNEVQVGGVIGLRSEKPGQNLVSLLAAGLWRAETNPAAHPVNMGIHWKGGHIERELHHNRGGLRPDTFDLPQPLSDRLRGLLP